MESIFGRGVYVDENTSHPANVRGGSRKPRALQQGANLIVKKAAAFLTVLKTAAPTKEPRFCIIQRAAWVREYSEGVKPQ